jgi:hypothetical protein
MAKPKRMWRLATGEFVYDRTPSHVHAGVRRYLGEVIGSISSGRRSNIVHEAVFDSVVGESNCVETRPGDRIMFARRAGRKTYTRFVLNRSSQETRCITVILHRRNNGTYVVGTAHFGRRAPLEPWGSRKASRESLVFWKRHALVWGSEPTIPGTERPYAPRT